MAGPDWSTDAPRDRPLIVSNCTAILAGLLVDAPNRDLPTPDTVKTWHARAYDGCQVPVAGYVGHFRGDPTVEALVGYEVGIGLQHVDGLPAGVGVWSSQVDGALASFFASLHTALTELDRRFPVGVRLTDPADLQEVVALAAIVHGEWVRIHPFVNGNGRTARLWTAFIAFRYGLPAFVQLKPRPDGVLYARAAMRSMGRPPDFVGDHNETIAVFPHWLRKHLGA